MSDNVMPPLDMDLNTVDISLPLLTDGYYDLLITKAEIKPTNAGGRMISLEHKNTAPATNRKGEAVAANACTVFNNVNLVPTGKSTWPIVVRGLAELVQAVPGGIPGAGPQNADTWVPQLLGKVVRARVGYEPAGKTAAGKAFKEKNTLEYYVKAGSQQ